MKPSKERLDASVHLILEHRKHADVSLHDHVGFRMAALWRQVRQRQRVYLDTRFWIWLRDAAMGRPRQPAHTALLNLLREKVQSGEVICSLGDGSFTEVLRQSDPETRLATARVMDELSLGVTIQNAQDRLKTEVLHFLVVARRPDAAMAPPLETVWLKAAYALGVLHPMAQGVDRAEQLALAKTFVDLMWSLTLQELLVDTPTLPDAIHQAFRDTAADLTSASKAHVSEVRNWNTLYADEVHGFFDACGDDLQGAFLQLYRRQHPDKPPPTEGELANSKRLAVNSFTNLVRLRKIGNALPLAQIEAGLHAIVRWHRNRPFSAQDFIDMNHATAALPYCHMFLTERFLGTVLSRPPSAWTSFGRQTQHSTQSRISPDEQERRTN